jgi:UPF0755 protein
MIDVNKAIDEKRAQLGDSIKMSPHVYLPHTEDNAGEFFFNVAASNLSQPGGDVASNLVQSKGNGASRENPTDKTIAMLNPADPGRLAADKIVTIVREEDGGSIAAQLERAGVIESAMRFDNLTELDGKRGRLTWGEYLFRAGVSMRDVEEELLAHQVLQHKLIIPDGLTSDQIVQRLRDDDVLIGEIRDSPREGSLMPDSYYFERGDTRQSILTRMAKAQAKVLDEIWKNRATDLPIKSPGEMVTLASIVEKEVGASGNPMVDNAKDDRRRVASVFVNRLQKHMRLDSDPTIVYGLVLGKGALGHSITKAELIQPTPYNTYLIDGLPPGPICNPGKAALEAAANPAQSKDLYFVPDGAGGRLFAATLDQHIKNVAHWRQIEKDVKDRLAPDATSLNPPAIPSSASASDKQRLDALINKPDQAAPKQ